MPPVGLALTNMAFVFDIAPSAPSSMLYENSSADANRAAGFVADRAALVALTSTAIGVVEGINGDSVACTLPPAKS